QGHDYAPVRAARTFPRGCRYLAELGAMKPLILTGRAPAADVEGQQPQRQSWRLRAPAELPAGDRDAALIAHEGDWAVAQERGYGLAISRDERPSHASLSYIRLPDGFAELDEGDVMRV